MTQNQFDINKALSEPKSIEIYRSDVVIKRDLLFKVKKRDATKKRRGVIKQLSAKSRKRLAFLANNTSVTFRTLITLTYPATFTSDGKEVKKHLNNMLTWLRQRYSFLEYIWFLEFQKRGAPHFHILVNVPFIDHRDVAVEWSNIVTGGDDDDHLKAGVNVERVRDRGNLSRYIVKYAMKPYQKTVPDEYSDVGRFWGNSWGVKPPLLGVVVVDGLESVRALVRGWAYECVLDRDMIVSVLYNCSKTVRERLRFLDVPLFG